MMAQASKGAPDPPGRLDPYWPASEGATFLQALEAGSDVMQQVAGAIPSLPPKDLSKPCPSSLSEALAVYHQREEEKRKKGLGKTAKGKQRSRLDSDTQGYPGAREGAGDQSAFWMYVEDYFREVTQEDVQGLVAAHLAPLGDPLLKVPPCGRPLQREEAAAAGRDGPGTRGGGYGERDGDAVDSKPYLDPSGLSALERRSSRLVSRSMKEDDSRRLVDVQAEEEARAEAEAAAAAVAAAAAAAAMATAPVTAAGAPAGKLLEIASHGQVLQLTSQIVELQQQLGLEAGPPVTEISEILSLLNLSCNTQKEPHPAVRTKLHGWLEAKAAALSAKLGAAQEVPDPYALRRVKGQGTAPQQQQQQAAEAPMGDGGGGAAAASAPTANDGAAPSAAPPQQQQQQPSAQAGDGLGADVIGALPLALYRHPYTQLMLQQKVPQHVVTAAVEAPEPPPPPPSKQAGASTPGQGGGSAKATEDAEVHAAADGGATLGPPAPALSREPSQQQLHQPQPFLLVQPPAMPQPLEGSQAVAAAPAHGAGAMPQPRTPWFMLPPQLAAAAARATPPPASAGLPAGTPPLPPHLAAAAAATAAGLAKAWPGLTLPLPGTAANGGTPLLFHPRPGMPLGLPTVGGARPGLPPVTAAAVAAVAASAAAVSAAGGRPPLMMSPAPRPFASPAGSPALTAPAVAAAAALAAAAAAASAAGTAGAFGGPRSSDGSPSGVAAASPAAAASSPQQAAQHAAAAAEAAQPADSSQQQQSGVGGGDESGRPGSAASSRGAVLGRSRSQVNYNVLAGRKNIARSHTGPPKKRPPSGPSVGGGSSRETDNSAQNPVALAVAAMVAAGAPDGPATEQWGSLQQQTGLIAAAPEDEIMAELLATQNELLQQMAVNRGRLLAVVQNLMADLGAQRELAQLRDKEEEEVKAWIDHLRDQRRRKEREKRDQQWRERQAQKNAAVLASPRPRQRLATAAEVPMDIEAPHLGPEELFDVLAQRRPEEEAFCAVCADGHSEAPNEIVFCERCDLAVHQACYDIPTVPKEEWLCWPCKKYEEEQLAKGAPQQQIRPARWQQTMEALPGGSRDVTCALCPIKCGAFRQTVDGKQWVHQVDVLWHPETFLVGGPNCAVVAGVENLRPERMGAPCAICHLSHGALAKCCQSGCPHAFHPLCARNCGLYLAIRGSPGKQAYRIYCALHSPAQRAKDIEAQNKARAASAAAAQQAAVREQAKLQEKRRVALFALEDREAERDTLKYERVCWEKLRVLCDQVKKREKTKAHLARLVAELQRERQEHPEEALLVLEAAVAARVTLDAQLPPPLPRLELLRAQQEQQQQQQGATGGVGAAAGELEGGLAAESPAAAAAEPGALLGLQGPPGGGLMAQQPLPAQQQPQSPAHGQRPQHRSHHKQRSGSSSGAMSIAQQMLTRAAASHPGSEGAGLAVAVGVAAGVSPDPAGRAKCSAVAAGAGLGGPAGAGCGTPLGSKRRRTPSMRHQDLEGEGEEGGMGEAGGTEEEDEARLNPDEDESEEVEEEEEESEDEDLRPSKRSRVGGHGHGGGGAGAGAGSVAAGGATASRYHGTTRQAAAREAGAAAQALRLQRELEMTRSQAAAANQQLRQRLPTGKLQYVPVERLRQQQAQQEQGTGAGGAQQEQQQQAEAEAAEGPDMGLPATAAEPGSGQGRGPTPRKAAQQKAGGKSRDRKRRR